MISIALGSGARTRALSRERDGARLSEEATKSTKIIAESVAQWKDALENIAGRRL
jgi:hypothetical protein